MRPQRFKLLAALLELPQPGADDLAGRAEPAALDLGPNEASQWEPRLKLVVAIGRPVRCSK
jgi:hypothetical protein